MQSLVPGGAQSEGRAWQRQKADVREFWDAASCGERDGLADDLVEQHRAVRETRHRLEPFADFPSGRGRDVLEIGVGMGTDHRGWALLQPKSLTGVDLTPRAVEFATSNLAIENLTPNIRVADAENLPFEDDSFDIVYSWGVLHHSPDTSRAFREVLRVLRSGPVVSRES